MFLWAARWALTVAFVKRRPAAATMAWGRGPGRRTR